MIDIKDLLNAAVRQEASDVHICVGAVPKFRIHGELTDTVFPRLSPSDTLEILLNLINQEQRERFEKNGEIDMSVSVPDVGRFRINAYKQRGSITLAFRIVDQQVPDPADLKLPESVLSLTEKRRGLILVTGPSGSGKSTVLAALLDRINSTRACNIITLEDPIEYLHSHKLSVINQREIGLDVPSYEAGLTSALREDPDVIFLSTFHSAESILTALMAVETGKLVLSSMYTNSAKDTIRGILEVFPRENQKAVRTRLSGALCAVISRKLMNLPGGEGRIPAHEILICNKEVKDIISDGNLEELPGMIRKGAEQGMCLMDDSLLALVKSGKIGESEALLSANDPEALQKALSEPEA